jgi:hypothetical protein
VSAASVAAACATTPKWALAGQAARHPGQLGQRGPGLLASADVGGKVNRPRAKLVQAPAEDGRTAIGGILYTFLSAYERLAPSGLRRFILQSPRKLQPEVETGRSAGVSLRSPK